MKSELDLYFQFRCFKGMNKRGLSNKPEYEERLEYEIDTISSMGFSGYFLVVSDMVTWAISQGIPVGPGRGSAAGSLVSYVLEITHLDPIKYGLIFERFLNPERVSLPDVDLDFCEQRRGEVFKYIEIKYGTDKFAHIGTYGSMKARAAIRDVTRTLGFPYSVGDELANFVLPPIEGKPQPLSVCYEKVPELFNIKNGESCNERTILEWAERFEGRLRSFGTHASGIVISDTPIAEIVPLYRGVDKTATTQYDMNIVDEIGLIKFDILGLSALTTIDRCCKSVAKRHSIAIDPLQIPVDDPETFAMLRSGDVEGCFQLEGSSGMKDLLVQIRPTRLEDLSLLVAIYRPGPLGSSELEHYLQVKAGLTTPNYLVPELEPILGDTGGMLIYQEQVLEIAKQLAGYTLGEADLLRRAIGKKKQKEMDAQEARFKQGIQDHGLPLSVAEALWVDINNFAGYGFNRAHAMCYAYVGYQMAYLKCHYRPEFMYSCLVTHSGSEEQVIKYLQDCRDHNILILPPDINESDKDFTLTPQGEIRFGLSVIKNIGSSVTHVAKDRTRHGHFKDILDFANRIGMQVDKRQFESLVLAGAFDKLTKYGRASLMGGITDIIRYREENKRYLAKLETYNKRLAQYNERDKEIEKFEKLSKDEKRGKKRPVPIKLPVFPIQPWLPKIPVRPEFSAHEKLLEEKKLLGYYVSGHPIDLVSDKRGISIKQLKEKQNKNTFTLLAIPSIIKEITTKKAKKLMAYVVLEDKTGTIQGVTLPDPYAQHSTVINSNVPALYTGQLEITEGDSEEDKTYKFLITSVAKIRMIEEDQRTTEITTPICKAIQSADWIKNHHGNAGRISFFVENRGNLWNFGSFGCRASREQILEKLND